MKFSSLIKRNYLLAAFTIGSFLVSLGAAMMISRQVLTTLRAKPLNTATLHTNFGDIKIAFREDTPKTVENFIKLAKSNFYDGTRFHRVVHKLLIQGGDPLSKFDNLKAQWGKGGPGYAFPDEIHSYDHVVRGMVAMANTGPDSNGSQFFMMVADADWMRGQNTIFADVVAGMGVVDRISNLPVGPTGLPSTNVEIESITLD